MAPTKTLPEMLTHLLARQEPTATVTVVPDVQTTGSGSNSGLDGGAIAGIVIGTIVGILLLWLVRRHGAATTLAITLTFPSSSPSPPAPQQTSLVHLKACGLGGKVCSPEAFGYICLS
ncbi:Chitin elicitor receptor kinase 1 [Madurella mycetomatis]|uniref:Chitin elicitor receptor kinase 1 n=1 Tax=Madurella mycetomatis TaxID=100816 RepID=A0A175VTE9_9PEZI|nr:Chitin elicitor receptor kinase 1 [Madurella mycetomatis]